MLFRTHLSLAFFLILFTYPFFDNSLLYSLFFLISTLFVDIDSKKSKVGKFILFRPIQFIFSHRGFIHSLIGCVLFSSLIFLWNASAGFGFLAGYLLHLGADCLTPGGIYLFYPFKGVRLRGPFKTGGLAEDIIFAFSFIFSILILFWIIFKMLF